MEDKKEELIKEGYWKSCCNEALDNTINIFQEIIRVKGIDDHEMMKEEKCEYCNKNINNKSIECIDATTDKSKLTILKNRYFGYTILAEIDNLADDSSNIPDVAEQFFKINYCPMCR